MTCEAMKYMEQKVKAAEQLSNRIYWLSRMMEKINEIRSIKIFCQDSPLGDSYNNDYFTSEFIDDVVGALGTELQRRKKEFEEL